MQGDSVTLNGKSSSGTFYWTPIYNLSGSTTLTPVVAPATDTTYTLHVTTTNGCGSAADAVFIRVYKRIIVPNAFSPNNDGLNDVWNIEALQSYPTAEVTVFNRYGQSVFYSRGRYKPWNGLYNGLPIPFGVYYYIIDPKEGLPKLAGSITVIR
jgi:gliding motility-associated-like protein